MLKPFLLCVCDKTIFEIFEDVYFCKSFWDKYFEEDPISYFWNLGLRDLPSWGWERICNIRNNLSELDRNSTHCWICSCFCEDWVSSSSITMSIQDLIGWAELVGFVGSRVTMDFSSSRFCQGAFSLALAFLGI